MRRLLNARNGLTAAITLVVALVLALLLVNAIDQRQARQAAEVEAGDVREVSAAQVGELLRRMGQKDDRIAMLERTVGEQAQANAVLAEQLRRADQEPLVVQLSGVRATARPQPRPSGPSPKPAPSRQPEPKPTPKPEPSPTPEPCPVPRLPVIGCPIP